MAGWGHPVAAEWTGTRDGEVARGEEGLAIWRRAEGQMSASVLGAGVGTEQTGLGKGRQRRDEQGPLLYRSRCYNRIVKIIYKLF